jgi:ClpX C4-type zinc finger
VPVTEEAGVGEACSFCLKTAAEVGTLVAGPGVRICDGCVALSAQIIAAKAEMQSAMPGWEQQLSDADLLAHLPRIAAAGAQVDRELTTWVRRARERSITWARIGAALGMTRQSAWERFSGEE